MASVSTHSTDVVTPNDRRWSLRNRLMLLAVMGTLVAWIMGASVVYFVAAKESHELFDERLHRMGSLVLSFSEHEIDEIRSEGRDIVHVETELTLGTRYKYQVVSGSGELLLLSHDAPRALMAPLGQVGCIDREVEGVMSRTEIVWNADRSKGVIIAEPLDRRSSFVGALHGYLIPMFLLSFGSLLVLNWWLFHRAMDPLKESATQLIDRSPSDLRPIQVERPPTELEPLITSMNGLFERVPERTRGRAATGAVGRARVAHPPGGRQGPGAGCHSCALPQRIAGCAGPSDNFDRPCLAHGRPAACPGTA